MRNQLDKPFTRVLAIACISMALAACGSNPRQAEPTAPVTTAPFELNTSSRGPVLTIDDVLFDFEEASLRPQAQSVMRQAAQYLAENPDRVAIVEGHTDHTGDKSYNQMLSDARAQAVQESLARYGVDANRIRTRGFGESQPVASNDTPAGRQANRRVEVVFQRSSQIASR